MKNNMEMWQTANELDLKVGDTIRDIEDGDCYFEGTVITPATENNELTYKVDRVHWCGEDILDDELIGQTIPLRWWLIEKKWMMDDCKGEPIKIDLKHNCNDN